MSDLNEFLNTLQSADLDALIGGTDDALSERIWRAQENLNKARQELREVQQRYEAEQAEVIASVYSRADGGGRNDKERKANEAAALLHDERLVVLRREMEYCQRRIEQIEIDLDYLKNQQRAVQYKAQVAAALLNYCAATGQPLPGGAAQSRSVVKKQNGKRVEYQVDGERPMVQPDDEMPF